jgi:ParB family chromosome partitioning protein
LEYAISNQRNRRNLTDADILRCVAALDSRNEQRRGGDRKSELSKASTDAFDNSGKSAGQTAALVGTSQAKVERARTVLDHATPEVRQAVESGETTINKAYTQTQQDRKTAEAFVLTGPLYMPSESRQNARTGARRRRRDKEAN